MIHDIGIFTKICHLDFINFNLIKITKNAYDIILNSVNQTITDKSDDYLNLNKCFHIF